MKIGITLIVIIFSVVAIWYTYTPNNPSLTEVSVLQDVTDTQMIQPHLVEVLSLFNFEDKWNGFLFRYTDITDVSLNQTSQAKLESQNQWLSNEMDRDKEIDSFKGKVADIISKAEKNNRGKAHSSVYLPIAKELNHLNESVANRKVLLIYSDLMENTQELSFYKPYDIIRLKKSPDEIQQKFEEQIPIDSLSGIEVYFIYQPGNNKSDQDFQIISDFYRKLLEVKGAKVSVSANINL